VAKTRRQQPSNRAAGTASPAGSAPAPTPTDGGPPRPTADARAAERIERQRQRAAVRRRQEQMRLVRTALLALVAVVIVGGGIIWLVNARNTGVSDEASLPGRAVPSVGQAHINDGEKGTGYNSVPPTSGPHYQNPAPNGAFDQPIPDEVQVHNLEHGQIMIQYTCTDCPELAAQLKPFADRFRPWVLVAPYPNPNVGSRIVLTAWGRIDTFDEFDEQRTIDFINAFKNKGPERNVVSE
jgi:hypothetical protein